MRALRVLRVLTRPNVGGPMRQAVALYQRCMQEVKPALHPKSRRQLKDENGRALFNFNAAVAARALELVGKHTDVGAFEEHVKHDHDISIIAEIQAGRRRAGMGRVEDVEPVEVPKPGTT